MAILRRITRALELSGKQYAKDVGMTDVQLRVLRIVAESRSTTPTAVANHLGVTQATMTSLIDKLCDKGLVHRSRSERDRRQTIIAATPEGTRRTLAVKDPLKEHFASEFEALEDWEQTMIVTALERIASLLAARDIDSDTLVPVESISGRA
ncbi:MAG: MarR family winged helix-turn-helix transcriptional regulator [Pseudooceanicola sp.]